LIKFYRLSKQYSSSANIPLKLRIYLLSLGFDREMVVACLCILTVLLSCFYIEMWNGNRKNCFLLSKKDKKIAEIVTLKIFIIFSQRCLPIAQAHNNYNFCSVSSCRHDTCRYRERILKQSTVHCFNIFFTSMIYVRVVIPCLSYCVACQSNKTGTQFCRFYRHFALWSPCRVIS
jgi:hypothetical protein